MNRTIEDIQKDIELLGIKGGYDIEQLLTPQDCRRLSYEIERLNTLIDKYDNELTHKTEQYEYLRHRKNYIGDVYTDFYNYISNFNWLPEERKVVFKVLTIMQRHYFDIMEK